MQKIKLSKRITHTHYFFLIFLSFLINLLCFLSGLVNVIGSLDLMLLIGVIPLGFGIHGIYKIQADLAGFYSEVQSESFSKHWSLGLLLSLLVLLGVIVFAY